ncbi:VanZ family protein [Phragmitibacter flavus]|uniref:VanZ family protein n=1 Tax=Phragmitibacter flavus TaxID=2576071 RepID=UPI0014095394|nr:VanZ family protein [Phragmitibacter flavus]
MSWLWLALGAVVLGLCVMPLPGDWREGGKALWLNVLHWPVAAGVALGWLSWQRRKVSWGSLMEAVLLVAVAGAGAEMLQLFTGRTFDGHDVFVNGLGALGGALTYARRSWGGWVLPLALMTSVPAWWPLVERVQLETAQRELLPVIGSQGGQGPVGLWQREVDGVVRGDGDDLVLELVAGKWSSLRRPGFGGDWSDYAGIEAEYEWMGKGDAAVKMGLRIDGRNGGRINGEVELQPGTNRLMMRFAENDEAVLNEVEQLVCFFRPGENEGRIRIGEMRLWREKEMGQPQ